MWVGELILTDLDVIQGQFEWSDASRVQFKRHRKAQRGLKSYQSAESNDSRERRQYWPVRTELVKMAASSKGPNVDYLRSLLQWIVADRELPVSWLRTRKILWQYFLWQTLSPPQKKSSISSTSLVCLYSCLSVCVSLHKPSSWWRPTPSGVRCEFGAKRPTSTCAWTVGGNWWAGWVSLTLQYTQYKLLSSRLWSVRK